MYKSVCVTLSFPDLTYICFKFFLLTADKNNRLNRKNNWLIFWKSTKIALCFAFLSFFLCDSSLTFIITSKFLKIFCKQFTLPLVKVKYSNKDEFYGTMKVESKKLVMHHADSPYTISFQIDTQHVNVKLLLYP